MLDLHKAKFVDDEPTAPAWRLIHRQADIVVPALRTAFVRAVRAVEQATPWPDVLARLEAGRLEVDDLVPWGSTGAIALYVPVTRILGELFNRVGTLTARDLGVVKRALGAGVFQPGHARARDWAQKHAADLVVEITAEQQAALRAAVTRAYEEGLAPRILARDLRQIVGLTRAQAVAVVRRRADLMAAGVSPETIVMRVERYAAKLLRVRTETIARTETIKASTQGQLESWRQSREAGLLSRSLVKQWIVSFDDRLCPICEPLAGKQADVDGNFHTLLGSTSGPPAHPNCRCAIGLSIPRRRAA